MVFQGQKRKELDAEEKKRTKEGGAVLGVHTVDGPIVGLGFRTKCRICIVISTGFGLHVMLRTLGM